MSNRKQAFYSLKTDAVFGPHERRRSKLELYVDTIEALASSGPMPLARLTLRTKINNIPEGHHV